MKVFISGGCKNGKSRYAQHLAVSQKMTNEGRRGPLYYIATMKPVDDEDDERILRHRREREGWGFTTIEQPFDIERILDTYDHNGSFLLDSLTALLSNEMFPPGGAVNEKAAQKINAALLQIIGKVRDIVIVSDYIYSDALVYDPLTEQYRRALAEIDRTATENCDVVLEAAYTNITVHKGREMFRLRFKPNYGAELRGVIEPL